jgi:hypothetical protein
VRQRNFIGFGDAAGEIVHAMDVSQDRLPMKPSLVIPAKARFHRRGLSTGRDPGFHWADAPRTIFIFRKIL